jgi:translation initiation factor IF-2
VNAECILKCIHAGVGAVTASDVDMAARTGAVIFTFALKGPTQAVEKEARMKQVEMHHHQVVYALMEDMELVVTRCMELVKEEEVVGASTVVEVIPISTKGKGRGKTAYVAGVRVTEGMLHMDCRFRWMRDGVVLMDDLTLASMRHYQEKVSEIAKGQECGLNFHDHESETSSVGLDFKPEDVFQAYRVKHVPPKLQLARR